MLLKYALSGTHGTGKTTLINNVADKARASRWMVEIVSSPTRYIKALGAGYGMDNNKALSWQFEWMLMAELRRRQWEAEKKLLEVASEPWTKPRLILGDRCLLDPVAYCRDKINRYRGGVAVLTAPPEVQRLRLIHELGREMAFEDVISFWDMVAYKPPHPDHLTADPDRLDDRQYQLDVDTIVRGLHGEAVYEGMMPLYLDADRDVAADELWEAIQNDYTGREATERDRQGDRAPAG